MNPILIIISLNVGLAIATSVSPGLIYDLALYSPAELFVDKPWGLVTSMFVHDGFFHLFANMITLYFFVSYLIRLIGERNFLIIYFIGGILGNIFYLLLGSPFSVAIGASGAVFAVGGGLTAMRPKLTVFIIPIPVPIPLWIAVIGGFLILSFMPGVAWQAHLGGLVFGLVIAYFFMRRERRFS